MYDPMIVVVMNLKPSFNIKEMELSLQKMEGKNEQY